MRTLVLKKKTFSQKGFVVFKNLIDKKICRSIVRKLEFFKNFSQAKKNKDAVFEQKKIKYFKNINFYINEFNVLFSNDMLKLASKLINQKVYYLNMGLHNKISGNYNSTPPHQDNFYWCRKPNDALTAYVALNNQSFRSGGIGYLPKSHKGRLYNHKRSHSKAFSSYIEFNTKVRRKYHFPRLSSGDVVFHHCNLIHISSTNKIKNYERKSVAITIYGINTKLDKVKRKKYLKNFRKNN